MKILLFGNSTWCLDNFRAGLISSLCARGCEVIALAPIDPTYNNAELINNLEGLGAKFVEVPLLARSKNPFKEIFSIYKIFNIIKTIDPDIILTFTIKCNLYTGLCRRFLSCRQIANIPGLGEAFARKDWSYKVVCLLYRLAFKDMSVAFFQNKEDLNYCTKNELLNPKIARLIPGSGVNLRKFVPQLKKKSDDPIVFLMFGRLLPQKGYYNYLAVAEKLSTLYAKKVEFWILGIEDKNRKESKMLFSEIKSAANRGIVKYINSVVDVRPILSKADVVCLPSSYNEGIPRSLLEAMAEGKAIITTDWKGCRETVQHEHNGLLIKPNSFQSLFDAMENMIHSGHGKISEMGMKSREIVEQQFDEDYVIQAYLSEIFPEFQIEQDKFYKETIYQHSAVAQQIETPKTMTN